MSQLRSGSSLSSGSMLWSLGAWGRFLTNRGPQKSNSTWTENLTNSVQNGKIWVVKWYRRYCEQSLQTMCLRKTVRRWVRGKLSNGQPHSVDEQRQRTFFFNIVTWASCSSTHFEYTVRKHRICFRGPTCFVVFPHSCCTRFFQIGCWTWDYATWTRSAI